VLEFAELAFAAFDIIGAVVPNTFQGRG